MTPAPDKQEHKPSIDNAGQAALAEAQREYTVGGDDNTKPAAADETDAAHLQVTRAIARVRATDRPSPFGVAQFPPLPVPPGKR